MNYLIIWSGDHEFFETKEGAIRWLELRDPENCDIYSLTKITESDLHKED